MKWLALAMFATGLAAAGPVEAADAPPSFAMLEAPKLLPDVHFEDDAGQPHALAEFHGKVVLLNIWATWCLPCRKEMPTLDRLQAALGGPEFEVVALSIDRRGVGTVRPFFDEVAIRHLAIRIDASGKALRDLGALGLPTTILVDRQGQELGRLMGPAEWDTPEMVAFLKGAVAQQAGTTTTPLQ
jgi:thiol-disulfide isomerase/thioredoxin